VTQNSGGNQGMYGLSHNKHLADLVKAWADDSGEVDPASY